MRCRTLLLALLLAPSAALAQHADTRPTARDVASLARPSGPVLSPDGRWVAWDITSYRFDEDAEPSDADTDAGWSSERQIWLAPADASAPARQLTFAESPSRAPQFTPDSSALAFLREADDATRIHVLPLRGGEAYTIDIGDIEPGAFRFSPNGDRIAFIATPKPTDLQTQQQWRAGGGYDWEAQFESDILYIVPIEGGDPVAMTDRSRSVNDFAWAPNGQSLAIVTSRNSDPYEVFNRNTIRVVSAFDGEFLNALETEPTSIEQISFSPSGDRLAWTVTRGTLSVLNHLVVHDLTNGQTTNAAAALDPTISSFVWANDDTLIAHVQEKTRSRLYRLPVDGSKADAIRYFGRVIGSGLSADADASSVVALTSSMLDAPTPTIIETESGGYELLDNVNHAVDQWQGFDYEVVTWQSPEGETLEGVLAITPHRKPDVAPPLMVLPHGGPDSVTQESFFAWSHYFTARGFSVFRPNYRGGTAYGMDFYAANRGRLGEIEFMDIEAGVDALIEKGMADPNRLVYGGWSWGGYLTAWTIGHTNRYQAAVAGAAITDVVAQYVGSDINHGVAAEWEYTGNPWEQTEKFDAADPIRRLRNTTTPTLIIHGEGDDRVPFSQGLTLYRALIDLGVETKFLAYPREPHGFREPAHIEHMLNAWAQWYLDRVFVD